ncbi:MAG: hypothetical protein M1818_001159 [Claussenomyces sp. TS43310]|nr:MAG: hypothetical protein M1818_001159 [Claussenomyces sp. TS43310]
MQDGHIAQVAGSNDDKRNVVQASSTKFHRILTTRSPALLLSLVMYQAHTLYLFTRSDFKTMIYPMTFFGLSAALSPVIFTPSHSPHASEVFSRAILVPTWIWLNLLPFCIANQRHADAVKEDALNKPWRPIPAGRMTSKEAGVLVQCLYPLVWLLSIFLGGGTEAFQLIVQGIAYNDFGGGDANPFIRNAINAGGYLSFQLGALSAATATQSKFNLPTLLRFGIPEPASPSGSSVEFSARGKIWFLLLAVLFFTTVHIQDLPDQDGDAKRQRRTFPLVFGDAPARWTLAAVMTVWSLATPWFWSLGWKSYLAPLGLGLFVVLRTLMFRDEKQDRLTFKIWNGWVIAVYLLPLVKSLSEA